MGFWVIGLKDTGAEGLEGSALKPIYTALISAGETKEWPRASSLPRRKEALCWATEQPSVTLIRVPMSSGGSVDGLRSTFELLMSEDM